jgi:hypothetical protein
MNTWISLAIGALTFKTETYQQFKRAADVFLRGFVVLVIVALIVGAFNSGVEKLSEAVKPTPTLAEVQRQVAEGFRQNYYGPAEMQPMIEGYIRDGVQMVYSIIALEPRFVPRGVTSFLEWIGETISTPLQFGWVGWLLLGGVFVHFAARWLGGKGTIAQLVGLGALAFLPRLLDVLSALVQLVVNLTGVDALGLIGSLIGWIVLIWSVAMYVKATSVAEELSLGRAVGAIVIAGAVMVGIVIGVIVVAIVFGIAVGGMFGAAG